MSNRKSWKRSLRGIRRPNGPLSRAAVSRRSAVTDGAGHRDLLYRPMEVAILQSDRQPPIRLLTRTGFGRGSSLLFVAPARGGSTLLRSAVWCTWPLSLSGNARIASCKNCISFDELRSENIQSELVTRYYRRGPSGFQRETLALLNGNSIRFPCHGIDRSACFQWLVLRRPRAAACLHPAAVGNPLGGMQMPN